MKLKPALGLIAGIFVSLPAYAQTTETFDALSGMVNAPGTAVPVGSQLSQQFLSAGVVFSSDAGYVAVVNHEPGDPFAEPSPPNIIGGTTSGGLLDYNDPITATFFYNGDLTKAGVTDYVKVLGDLIPIAGTATLNAYDINGVLLGSDTEPDQELGGLSLSFSGAGIHSIQLTEQSGTIGFDNFTFDAVTLPVLSAVPEPATWAMMFLGFGLVGMGLRRSARIAKGITA